MTRRSRRSAAYRLARNVAFISELMEAKVDFIAVDNPHATRLTLHILAAVMRVRGKHPFGDR